MLLRVQLVVILLALTFTTSMVRAGPNLIIYPSVEGGRINGIIMERSHDNLYLITHQRPYPTYDKEPEFRLEVRSIHDPETIKWYMSINELPGVQPMINGVGDMMLTLPLLDLIILDNSVVIMLNLPSQTGDRSLLFRISQEGSVVANREFNSNRSDIQLGIFPSIGLSRHGIVVSYSNGITIIDDQSLATITSWEWGTLHSPNSIFQVQSVSVLDDEIFFLEFVLKDAALEHASIAIKKFGLSPTISLDSHMDLNISSNAWNVTKFDLLATRDGLIMVGIDETWSWIICEFSRDLAILAPCEKLDLSSVAPKNIDAKSFYPRPPNLVGVPKGYIWDMYVMRRWEHSPEITPLIGMRTNGSTGIQQLDLPLDEYSSIQGRLVFSRSDAGYFVLAPIGVFFDGHHYMSLQLYEMPH